jgi:hypothetical protein
LQCGKDKPILVSILQVYKDYFVSGKRTEMQDLKTSFFLAITLVHEIAHATQLLLSVDTAFNVRRHSRNEGYPRHRSSEPCFRDTDTVGELGWSLERYLFGIEFQDSTHGNPTHHIADDDTSPWECIPTSWLQPFFLRSRWERKRRVVGKEPVISPTLRTTCVFTCLERYKGQTQVMGVVAGLVKEEDGFYTHQFVKMKEE